MRKRLLPCDSISDTPVRVDVLANDSDPDGGPLTAQVVCGPRHGTLQLNEDGSYTYTPDRGWYGTDGFSYRADDGEAESAIAMVHITVTYAPTARNASFQVERDGSVRIDFDSLTHDLDDGGLTLTVGTPGHGRLQHNEDGSYTYRPAHDFVGTDTFTYTVSDGTHSASATITLNVVQDGDDDDDGDGWNSQTVFVQSAQQVFGNATPNYGYIVVNRGDNTSGAQASSTPRDSWPELDWNAPTPSEGHGTGQTGGNWWSSLFNAPLLSAEDLARQSGLMVKKPH